MLQAALVILVVLWLLGYVSVPFFHIPKIHLFTLNGHSVDLYTVLIFIVILWLMDLLPSPFRQITGGLLILWLLSLFGIIAIANFSNIIIIALIIGVVLYLRGGFKH
jgi:hypothetical protein